MGFASTLSAPTAVGARWAPLSDSGHRRPSFLTPPLRLSPRATRPLTLARRRNSNDAVASSPKNENNKLQRLGKKEPLKVKEEEEEDIDGDALEALFAQLEEDLRKDDPSLFDGLEDISEEDLAKLDEELAAMDEEIAGVFDMADYDPEDVEEDDVLVEVDEDEDEDKEEEEEEEEEPLQLRNWQIRRLAMALKTGRRKTNIKSLAAELCIDRAVVLEMLRNPPPSLLMLSAALPDDEPSSPVITIAEAKTVEAEVETIPEPKPKRPPPSAKLPVHEWQQKFASKKRIKKAHLQTLEDVYRRSKRPTNSMIQSVVDVTKLPRKRVVKWFEDRRVEDGVPEQRVPYQRPDPDSEQ